MTQPKARFIFPEVVRSYALLPTRLDYGGRWAWLEEITLVAKDDGSQYACRKGWENVCIQQMINDHYFGDRAAIDDYEQSLVNRHVAAERFMSLMQPSSQEQEEYKQALDRSKRNK